MKNDLKERYKKIRSFSESVVSPLVTEDFVVQSMPDVSPTKWHLGHVSWFFETFILKKAFPKYKPLDENYDFIFNSYYVQVGPRFSRPERGLLSRPTVKDVYEYRRFVDLHMLEFLDTASDEILKEYKIVVEIGLNHEQQHQELMLTDIKHVFSINPLRPVYKKRDADFSPEVPEYNWVEFEEGIYETGYEGNSFFYDNEKPRHKAYLYPFAVADRLVTNAEYIEFIEDGGYSNVPLWLSKGAAQAAAENWKAPLYWEKIDGEWFYFTLNGFKKVNPSEPVCHVSKYEADAFANWKGLRLPTEREWEAASNGITIKGNFVESGKFHPAPLNEKEDRNLIRQIFGDVWEWTASDYSPYPGYKIPPGAIGEYNGKFMSEQIVLRGGSCATSETHIRNTYRNFFYPKDRWQFTGIRLAKDL